MSNDGRVYIGGGQMGYGGGNRVDGGCELSEPKADLDRVVMPRELTAENGAKALLMGEFAQEIPVFCPDCIDPVDKEDCVTCDGEGELYQHVNISWTNIKAIYAMAVKHLAANTQFDSR